MVSDGGQLLCDGGQRRLDFVLVQRLRRALGGDIARVGDVTLHVNFLHVEVSIGGCTEFPQILAPGLVFLGHRRLFRPARPYRAPMPLAEGADLRSILSFDMHGISVVNDLGWQCLSGMQSQPEGITADPRSAERCLEPVGVDSAVWIKEPS